jgi:KaiC/GvpD/RAD55 family RecA-like ATPase
MRAMKIIKRYRKTHPLNWIPYEITEEGIRIKRGLCIPKDHEYILIGEEYEHGSG